MSTATVETNELITVEGLLKLVEQLPRNEQLRLVQLIERRQPDPNKPPLDKPLYCEQPMPDRTREWEWIKEHKHEYAGQWVALDGDRLIAASSIEQAVWDAVKADSAPLPLVHRLSSREAMAQWEELKREQPAQLPREQRPQPEPMQDRTREWQWIKEHKHEYAGQWVALDGDRLVAASPIQQEVWDAVKTDHAKLPLVHRIPAPDDLPYIGI